LDKVISRGEGMLVEGGCSETGIEALVVGRTEISVEIGMEMEESEKGSMKVESHFASSQICI
jgi:hypothetical protein